MKLYKKVHHPSPIAGSYDYDTYEPIEITKDDVARFLIEWGVTFAPDECVDDDLEWKEYATALDLARDLLTKLLQS